MATANDELPIYIVRGVNWTVEVMLDEDDHQELGSMGQMVEAATKAAEMVLRYADKSTPRETDPTFVMDNGEEVPFIGAIFVVCLKGLNPEKDSEVIEAYIPLANGGFYMDSLDSKKALEETIKAMTKPDENKEQIENFEKLKAEIKAAKKKKKK